MAVRIVITPGDSMWWLMRPEFLAYVDEVLLDRSDYERVRSEKSDSSYRAVVWKRLSVLRDNGLLRLDSIEVDIDRADLEAERKIREILCDDAKARAFVCDMVFAYRYWIEFNQQRLTIMPVDDDYAASVTAHLPVWLDDLNLLVTRGKRAFIQRPEIVEQTARSILGRVGCLCEIARHHPGIALASLKEFQPFIKYVDCPPDEPLPGEPGVVPREYSLAGAGAAWRDLPVDPDITFLSFDLTKRSIWDLLATLRETYRIARENLGSLLDCPPEEMAEPAVRETCARLSAELDRLGTATRLASPYLRDVFYGLSVAPTPGFEPAPVTAGAPNASAMGSRSYYGILESMLDPSKFKKLPQARPRRRKRGRRAPSFWRRTDLTTRP